MAALAILGCGGSQVAPAGAAAPVMVLIDRAHAREKAHDYLAARALYERTVANAPDRASRSVALDELGSALVFFGEYAAAESVLAELAALDPARPRVWHDLGMLAANRGAAALAERRFRRAVALVPADPRPRIALAALLLRQHDDVRALAEYRALARLQLSPTLAHAVARAIALLDRGTPGAGGKRDERSPLY